MREIQISWARHSKTEKLINISKALDADRSNFVCIGCKQKLELVHRNVPNKIDFFRHQSKSDCDGQPESELHLLAKQIICESQELLIKENQKFKYSFSMSEKIVETGHEVDVYIENDKGVFWLVEIWCTHKTEDEKVKAFQVKKWNALEIRLLKSDWDLPLDKLKQRVLSDPTNREFLSTTAMEPQETNKKGAGFQNDLIVYFRQNPIVALLLFILIVPVVIYLIRKFNQWISPSNRSRYY